jgi:hypothetical protein
VRALEDLRASPRPEPTTAALGRYLTTNEQKIAGTIMPFFFGTFRQLLLGPANFRCYSQKQCKDAGHPTAVAYASVPITLCPEHFSAPRAERISTLIHESFHLAGLHKDVYEWKWPFPGLSEDERLANEDSYVAFTRVNYYPTTAPHESPIGLAAGLGLLVPGGPALGGGSLFRHVVTIEYDSAVATRIFRFADLHLGLGADFDPSGTMIGSVTAGPRLFAPVTASELPLFIDLRGGYAYGEFGEVTSLEGVRPGPTVSGPVGELRVGFLSGHVGGSVGYRQIISLVEGVPNLHQFTVAGEIRFP